jgi:pimeloyl-ACP methyl ester carboxylesterase
METYYEDQGASEVPILLIHASGATGSTWGVVAEELAARGRTITYDRRGYARTGGEPAGSIAVHTDDAAALLDSLQTPPVVAFGISVGATIAIDLARRRPDLVHAVVAHESPWHVTRHRPTVRQIRALGAMQWRAARGRHADAVEVFLRFAYAYRDGGSAWDAFPDEWRQVAREEAVASLDDIRIAVGAYPKARELAQVTRPVLCTCGDRSAGTMHDVTLALVRSVPTATFRSVAKAGHALAFDSPAGMISAIEDAVRST